MGNRLSSGRPSQSHLLKDYGKALVQLVHERVCKGHAKGTAIYHSTLWMQAACTYASLKICYNRSGRGTEGVDAPSRPARGYGGALEAPPGGMGERWKLPHGGLGRSPRSFAILAIFMFKSHTKFDHFSLTKL